MTAACPDGIGFSRPGAGDTGQGNAQEFQVGREPLAEMDAGTEYLPADGQASIRGRLRQITSTACP